MPDKSFVEIVGTDQFPPTPRKKFTLLRSKIIVNDSLEALEVLTEIF